MIAVFTISPMVVISTINEAMETTMSEIEKNANRIADLLREMGKDVLSVSHSTNRFGEKSSYIDMGAFRFRISDHSCNENFRCAEVNLSHEATLESLEKFYAQVAENDRRAKEEKIAEIAWRNEYEAPFKARYHAARIEEKRKIACECYKYMWSDDAAYRELKKRWKA
jgi:hypothetical protein